MSTHKSSLVLEETAQPLENQLELYIPVRYLDNAAEEQPKVVKISGSITVSF